jgi:hypothetical protein
MAGPNSVANSSLPNLSESFTQAETAPGTVTLSQPCIGMASSPAKRSGVQPAGERPEAFSPCSCLPSQRIANASDPIPLPDGSTTVSVMAVAMAASTALPPGKHRKPCLGSQRLRGCDQVVCGNGGSPGWVMVVGTQVHVIASGLLTMMSRSNRRVLGRGQWHWLPVTSFRLRGGGYDGWLCAKSPANRSRVPDSLLYGNLQGILRDLVGFWPL